MVVGHQVNWEETRDHKQGESGARRIRIYQQNLKATMERPPQTPTNNRC